MEEAGSSWTVKAKQLSQLLRGASSDETHIVELLEELNEFSYPVQGVASQVNASKTDTRGVEELFT